MKSLLNFRSLSGVAVITIVIAFMVSQATDTYASGSRDRLVQQIREALQGDFDEIRDEIANHTHDGGGGSGENCSCPGDILPAGGNTIGGPAADVITLTKQIYNNQHTTAQSICITLINEGPGSLRLNWMNGSRTYLLFGGERGTVCMEIPNEIGQAGVNNRVNLVLDSGDSAAAVWRIDKLQ